MVLELAATKGPSNVSQRAQGLGCDWQTLTFDGSGTNPNGWTETGKTYNATLIRQIGIETDTSGDTAAVGCTAATLHIDTVSY